MKTRKKTSKDIDSLDVVISKGKATIENPKGTTEKTKRGRGRPKSKVKKMQCPFYLPEDIVDAIAENCRGNKSVFAEEVFKFYFDQNGIEY
jgi:hypothetical protein